MNLAAICRSVLIKYNVFTYERILPLLAYYEPRTFPLYAPFQADWTLLPVEIDLWITKYNITNVTRNKDDNHAN